RSAAGLSWRSASSRSRSTWVCEVPAMLRVPPRPPRLPRGPRSWPLARGMLAHAEVVVRAPDRHLDRSVGGVPRGAREAPAMAAQVREDPVAPFRSQSRERADQDLLVPHCRPDLPFGHAFYNTRAVTALDRLATLRIARLPPRRRRALFRAVESAESAVELFHRHRAGARPVPHPIALTPFLVPRRAVPRLARLAALVHRLQAHAPAL